jgi:hypothetical protein
MLDKIKKDINDLKGTASELRDNSDYDKLVNKIGETGAQRAIQNKLQDRGLTIEKWITYREVKAALHKNPLQVREEIKEIDNLASGVLDN